MSGLFGSTPPPDAHDRLLIAAYERAGRTLDDLPYTPQFGAIVAAARGADADATPRAVLHRLHTLRKAGRLPRLGRGEAPPPRIEREEEAALTDLVVEAAGTLGQRDRLPFTPAFDRLVERFNAGTGRSLTPHDVWRLVARLAK
ncbi:MAG: hypothetical protein FJ255_08145 [Phycisphaerae bacterium]|nr:hypothetical protein [Phycisphaerae bacterium]